MMTGCLCALLGWAGLLRLAPTGPAPRAIARLASREPARAVPNSVQAEAIRSRDRAVLVLASAGTGKTRVLRTRMAWLLLKQSVPSSSILAVTFSQHAAQQLQARVTAVAGPAAEGAWLGTFHSICWRMLREHHHHLALPPDFRVAAEADQLRLLTEASSSALLSSALCPLPAVPAARCPPHSQPPRPPHLSLSRGSLRRGDVTASDLFPSPSHRRTPSWSRPAAAAPPPSPASVPPSCCSASCTGRSGRSTRSPCRPRTRPAPLPAPPTREASRPLPSGATSPPTRSPARCTRSTSLHSPCEARSTLRT